MPRAQLPFKSGYVVPFFAGLVAAPYIKPLFRLAVKKSVGAALRVRVLAAETAEELQDIVAEASVDAAAPGNGKRSSAPITAPKL